MVKKRQPIRRTTKRKIVVRKVPRKSPTKKRKK